MKGGEVYPGMEMDQQFPRARVVRFEETRYTQVTEKKWVCLYVALFSNIEESMVVVV
jgi:hypothetical protein